MSKLDKIWLVVSIASLILCVAMLSFFIFWIVKYPLIIYFIDWYAWLFIGITIILSVWVVCSIIQTIKKYKE